MSPLFESYLAGQVACLMEFAPMFWPTINSYKRLVDGFWAPVKPTWGLDNRTASFRVIAGSPKSHAAGDALPWRRRQPPLAMAAVIAAGLHGVWKGLKLTAPPITGTNQGADIPRAPRSLIETTRASSQTRHRPRLAGRHLRRALRRHARMGKWRQWQDGVTDWGAKRFTSRSSEVSPATETAMTRQLAWVLMLAGAAAGAGAAERQRHRDADQTCRHLGRGLQQAGHAAGRGRPA